MNRYGGVQFPPAPLMTFKNFALDYFDNHYWKLQFLVIKEFIRYMLLPRMVKRKRLDHKYTGAEKLYGPIFIVPSVPEAKEQLYCEFDDSFGYVTGIVQIERGEQHG